MRKVNFCPGFDSIWFNKSQKVNCPSFYSKIFPDKMRRWHGVSCYHSEQKIAKQEIIKQEEKCNSQYFWQLHFFAETNVNFLFGRISQRDLVFQTKLCLGIIFCDKRIIPNSQFSIGLIF